MRIKEPYPVVVFSSSAGLEWHLVIAEGQYRLTTEILLRCQTWEMFSVQQTNGIRTSISHKRQRPVRVTAANYPMLATLQSLFGAARDDLDSRRTAIYDFLFPKEASHFRQTSFSGKGRGYWPP